MSQAYPESFFVGIHIIYDSYEGTQVSGCSIDISDWSFINTNAFISTAILFVTKCSEKSPFLYRNDGHCYIECPEGTYNSEKWRECLTCTAPCFGCSNIPGNCSSCFFPNKLMLVADNLMTCGCGDGFYGHPLTGCYPCSF